METSPGKKTSTLARGSLRMQSDNRLVKLFRRGVDPAFDELVRRHRASLLAFAGAIAGRDRADDVVQDSLVKAHRSLRRDQPLELKPWLFTVVRNTALNELRDNEKHSHEGLGESAGRVEQPQDALERKEQLASLVAAVSELPASQRSALVGRELGGYTHEEIALQMDLTPGATKQLIYRARLTLRDAVGALIPVPIITWLVSDAAGVFTAGSVGGTAAGGALAAASGGMSAGGVSAGGATAGGVLAGIAGGGAAKIAVVAVVAGGSLAAGLAVEDNRGGVAEPPTAAAAGPAVTGSGDFPNGEGPQGSGQHASSGDPVDPRKGGPDSRDGGGNAEDHGGKEKPSGEGQADSVSTQDGPGNGWQNGKSSGEDGSKTSGSERESSGNDDAGEGDRVTESPRPPGEDSGDRDRESPEPEPAEDREHEEVEPPESESETGSGARSGSDTHLP